NIKRGLFSLAFDRKNRFFDRKCRSIDRKGLSSDREIDVIARKYLWQIGNRKVKSPRMTNKKHLLHYAGGVHQHSRDLLIFLKHFFNFLPSFINTRMELNTCLFTCCFHISLSFSNFKVDV